VFACCVCGIVVKEPQYGAYLYQAVEFRVGNNLAADEVEGSTLKQRKEVWLRGVAYAPALHVRKFDKAEQRKGYLFHTDFQDGDGDTALFGKCPEVVRVDNCTAWRPMSFVLELIPRVVHPNDTGRHDVIWSRCFYIWMYDSWN
jgi:hypothetical protein